MQGAPLSRRFFFGALDSRLRGNDGGAAFNQDSWNDG